MYLDQKPSCLPILPILGSTVRTSIWSPTPITTNTNHKLDYVMVSTDLAPVVPGGSPKASGRLFKFDKKTGRAKANTHLNQRMGLAIAQPTLISFMNAQGFTN